MKDFIVYSKQATKTSEQHLQLVSQLTKQNEECRERIQCLQSALSQMINNVEKNEQMMRKQVFRLKKQNAHLEAKTNLLAQHMQNQQKWNQNVCKWILQNKKQSALAKVPFATKEKEEELPMDIKKPLQFLPIYD